jgi:hypothetical protein
MWSAGGVVRREMGMRDEEIMQEMKAYDFWGSILMVDFGRENSVHEMLMCLVLSYS